MQSIYHLLDYLAHFSKVFHPVNSVKGHCWAALGKLAMEPQTLHPYGVDHPSHNTILTLWQNLFVSKSCSKSLGGSLG